MTVNSTIRDCRKAIVCGGTCCTENAHEALREDGDDGDVGTPAEAPVSGNQLGTQ